MIKAREKGSTGVPSEGCCCIRPSSREGGGREDGRDERVYLRARGETNGLAEMIARMAWLSRQGNRMREPRASLAPGSPVPLVYRKIPRGALGRCIILTLAMISGLSSGERATLYATFHLLTILLVESRFRISACSAFFFSRSVHAALCDSSARFLHLCGGRESRAFAARQK